MLLDVSTWNVSKVEDMSQMFLQCRELTSLNKEDNWDVISSINFKHMFYNCAKLTHLNVVNWDVSNVTVCSI